MLLFLLFAIAAAILTYKRWYSWAVFAGLCAIYASQLQVMMWLRAIFLDGTLNRK